MRCSECGVELSDDMLESGLCFECGCTFPPVKSNASLLREQENALKRASGKEREQIEKEVRHIRELVEKEERERRELARKEAKEKEVKRWKEAHPDADGRYYEYRTIRIVDYDSGQANVYSIERTLNQMGYDGWRLVTALTNEIGKTSHSSGYAGISSGTNATIDEVILIFERVVRIE